MTANEANIVEEILLLTNNYRMQTFSDENALESQYWFPKVIKYVEGWVLSGWMFEGKTCKKSCGYPALRGNINRFLSQIFIGLESFYNNLKAFKSPPTYCVTPQYILASFFMKRHLKLLLAYYSQCFFTTATFMSQQIVDFGTLLFLACPDFPWVQHT